MRPVLLAKLLGPVAIAVIALGQPAANAQPAAKANRVFGLPVESVTVIAAKPSQDTIKSFADTHAAVSNYRLARIARWSLQICPQTVGLGGKYADYISQRIRDIAADIGAPVAATPDCRPNVEVVFTAAPQRLMDNLHKTVPLYLGFHQTRSEGDELAKVNHPIQAWYTTRSAGVLDFGKCPASGTIAFPHAQLKGGVVSADAAAMVSTSAPLQVKGGVVVSAGGVHELELPCGAMGGGSGGREKDDLSSDFFNVLIVADPTKLSDDEIGTLADYIAMLALSQPASLDSCQVMPSISNLQAPGCASIPSRITDGDLAYLHALYNLPDGNMLATQRDYIRERMFKTLVTDKGG
jgi:hypothetical protein